MLPHLHGQSELSKVVVWLNRKVAKMAMAKRKKIKSDQIMMLSTSIHMSHS
jgi:hypothetical protein